MKKKLVFIFTLFLILACSEETIETSRSSSSESTPTTSSSSDEPLGGGVDVGSGGSDSGSYSSSGSSCYGDTRDGAETSRYDLVPIFNIDVMMAGGQVWVPGNYSDTLRKASTPDLNDSAAVYFNTDSTLKVRFKVHSGYYPDKGDVFCYGRTTGSTSSSDNPYEKLAFRIRLADILCDRPSSTDSSVCLSGFRLGSFYGQKYIDPVSVNECSPIIDLTYTKRPSDYGTVVAIDQVRSDQYCNKVGHHCPANYTVFTKDCWNMTLQIQTDQTVPFK